MTVSRTLSVELELLKRSIVTGNFVATLHSSMPSFNSSLAEEAGVSPSEVYKLTGPLLIGCFLSLVLYGILCHQVYIYYISFPKDNLVSKTVVYLLWVAETVQTAIRISYTFNTFCYEFGNIVVLDEVETAWFTILIMSGFVGCIAQLFYAWRMYKFNKKARWLCITLSMIAFIQFSSAICCGIQVRNSGRYSKFQNNSGIKTTVIIWLGGSALCDTAIALCMTCLLCRAQTGLKSTRILLSRLIRLAIETGTATGWTYTWKWIALAHVPLPTCPAVIAIIDMALYLASHNNNYYTVPTNCLVKVYSNTVLAVCNSRMTGRIRGGREDIVTLHSFDSFDLSIGGLNIEFRDTETDTNADSSLRPGPRSTQGFVNMHSRVKTYKKNLKEWCRRTEAAICVSDAVVLEMDNFQDPQLSSHKPLVYSLTFIFIRSFPDLSVVGYECPLLLIMSQAMLRYLDLGKLSYFPCTIIQMT
ncbi:hypothetical protein IW262DRAFT_1462466 [Armillaria fumosa]|nr:hypothetical protein IW262DRAFT_1462466 [Armillaria fumosa]